MLEIGCWTYSEPPLVLSPVRRLEKLVVSRLVPLYSGADFCSLFGSSSRLELLLSFSSILLIRLLMALVDA